MAGLLTATAFAVFWTCVGELILGLLRAGHEVGWYNWGLTLRRVLALGGSLLLVFVAGWGLSGFLWGQGIGEMTACLLLMPTLRGRVAWRLNWPVLSQALAYGLPHVLVIGAGLVLSIGDRYVIEYCLDESAVGLYVIGYTVAATLSSLITKPFNLFLFPSYTKAWEAQGARETETFLVTATERFLMVYVPTSLVVLLFQEPLLDLFAPESYKAAGPIIGVVFLGLVFHGLSMTNAAGFYLTQRTWEVGVVTLGAAALNIALNLLVVPRWGVIGAAVVTLFAYGAQYLVMMWRSWAVLPVRFPVKSFCYYVTAGAVMTLVTELVAGAGHLPALLGPIVALSSYVAALMLVDSQTRSLILRTLAMHRSSVPL
jgi:O-antigen/teichoic acid export membrane protein